MAQQAQTDIEAMVAAFVADVARTSLELPHLTTGERKRMKQFIEQYPELGCESYGFGAERRLHLFKAQSKMQTSRDVEMSSAQPALFTSDPSQACTEVGSVEFNVCDSEPINRAEGVTSSADARSAPPSPLSESCSRAHSESFQCSTTASVDGSNSSPSSPEMSTRGLPNAVVPAAAGPDDLLAAVATVRNTFLHIADPSIPVDARAVQSMPHGMFRQCLSEEPEVAATTVELSAAHKAADKALPASDRLYYPGMLVKIEGLSKLPAFNGLMGVVQSFDIASGRYDLLLASCEHNKAKVKAENLRPALPVGCN